MKSISAEANRSEAYRLADVVAGGMVMQWEKNYPSERADFIVYFAPMRPDIIGFELRRAPDGVVPQSKILTSWIKRTLHPMRQAA